MGIELVNPWFCYDDAGSDPVADKYVYIDIDDPGDPTDPVDTFYECKTDARGKLGSVATPGATPCDPLKVLRDDKRDFRVLYSDSPLTGPEQDTAKRNGEVQVVKLGKKPGGGPDDYGFKLKKQLKIVLTFDDGPHVPDGGNTDKILKELEDRGIAAAFFVQALVTVPERGGTERGLETIHYTFISGHVIAIHTGSEEDHAHHPCRALGKPKKDAGGADIGTNLLESDFELAKKRIESVITDTVEFARAPEGAWNDAAKKAYSNSSLKSIAWNVEVDTGEDPLTGKEIVPTLDNMKRKMELTISSAITSKYFVVGNQNMLVVLFHDRKGTTARNITALLDHLESQAKSRFPGLQRVHMKNRADVESAMSAYHDHVLKTGSGGRLFGGAKLDPKVPHAACIKDPQYRPTPIPTPTPTPTPTP